MSLKVTVYTAPDSEPDVLEADFVSYVDANTHGKPALIAPPDPVAKVGQRVLYINTSLVPMWTIHRVKDAKNA